MKVIIEATKSEALEKRERFLMRYSDHWTIVKSRARKAKGEYNPRVVGGEVAEDLFNRGLCLPSGTAMTNYDLDRILSTIHGCHK